MAKPAKSIPAASEVAIKPKNSKQMIIIIVAVLGLLATGGAVWQFTKGSSHAEAAKPNPALAPRFVKLDTFTVNLRHGEGEEERVLQTVINLEVHSAELEEKVKLFMPKIYNNVLILLSRKRPADISTPDGKQQLANDIKAEIEFALGLRAAPAPVAREGGAASGAEAAPHAVERAPSAAYGRGSDEGIADVLFTSFIIQ